MKNIYLLFITFFFLNADLQAFDLTEIPQDTTKEKRNSLSAFPVAYFTPETDWSFGAVGIYAFRIKGMADESRPSQVSLAGAYTLNKQILLFVPFQLFWKEAKWNWYGEIGYYRYNYFYYGIGNESKSEEEEIYDVNFPRLKLNALYRVYPKTYAGLRYWYDGYDIVGIKADGLLDRNRPVGTEGGNISGFGPVANYDSRDNIFSTTKGHYIEAASLFAFSGIGSDYNFSKSSLDARKFMPLGKEKKSVLALNAYAEFSGGDVPFYQLAFLGGGKRMRGYLEGRFRDRHYAMLQSEYRFPLFWRFGGVVFAGTGGVSSEVGDIFNDFRFSYGAGLRFLLDPKEGVNIRVDYGLGQGDNSGFYLTIGEAF